MCTRPGLHSRLPYIYIYIYYILYIIYIYDIYVCIFKVSQLWNKEVVLRCGDQVDDGQGGVQKQRAVGGREQRAPHANQWTLQGILREAFPPQSHGRKQRVLHVALPHVPCMRSDDRTAHARMHLCMCTCTCGCEWGATARVLISYACV